MRTVHPGRGYALGLTLAAALATTGYGQERTRPADDARNGGVHRMTITSARTAPSTTSPPARPRAS